MFIYLVTITDGRSFRIVTDGDPTDHPTFWGRVANVETLGEDGHLLSRSCGGVIMDIRELRYGGPLRGIVITLDDGTIIEAYADVVGMGHGETSPQLSYSVSDPRDMV